MSYERKRDYQVKKPLEYDNRWINNPVLNKDIDDRIVGNPIKDKFLRKLPIKKDKR